MAMKKIILSILIINALLLPGLSLAQNTDFLLDQRDGNIYLVAKFSDLWWMCQNLKFDAGEGSSCYDGDETNCMLHGRWYSFDAALRACPEGYRLPTDDDWKALESYIGMDKKDLDQNFNRNSGTVGKFLKVNGGIGFDAELTGMINTRGNASYSGERAYFWTATAFDEATAWNRIMEKSKDGVERQTMTRGFQLSVRCVRDAEKESTEEK